jgi:hypothetical protein
MSVLQCWYDMFFPSGVSETSASAEAPPMSSWDWDQALPELHLVHKQEEKRLAQVKLQKACRGTQALAPGARMLKVSPRKNAVAP